MGLSKDHARNERRKIQEDIVLSKGKSNLPLQDRLDRVAQLINTMSPLMKRNDSTPYDTVRNAQFICEQYGIRLIENFAKIPAYQQLTLVDCK